MFVYSKCISLGLKGDAVDMQRIAGNGADDAGALA
jgi:hypothetical protein